jgi:hypothetical protein
MDRSDVQTWVDRYVRAWETNDPQDIGGLFSEDARYYTAPHRKPWTGREGIVEGWLDRKDEQGDWTFRSEVIGIDRDVAFVRGVTGYKDEGKDYENLWMIRLDDSGRASEFIEWWMEAD